MHQSSKPNQALPFALQLGKSHQPQLVDWFIHNLQKDHNHAVPQIPPTAVGGFIHTSLIDSSSPKPIG